MKYKTINPECGKRLNKCLKSRGMSQKELADKSNYTSTYINYIINGKKNLSVEAATIFSKILFVNMGYLLCESDYMTDNEYYEDWERTYLHTSRSLFYFFKQQMLEIEGIIVYENENNIPISVFLPDNVEFDVPEDRYIKESLLRENIQYPTDNEISKYHADVQIAFYDAHKNKQIIKIPYSEIKRFSDDLLDYSAFKINQIRNKYLF